MNVEQHLIHVESRSTDLVEVLLGLAPGRQWLDDILLNAAINPADSGDSDPAFFDRNAPVELLSDPLQWDRASVVLVKVFDHVHDVSLSDRFSKD